MRLSALFDEFLTFLRVEQEAAPRSIETYRWCFRDFEAFTMLEIGGTVLVVTSPPSGAGRTSTHSLRVG